MERVVTGSSTPSTTPATAPADPLSTLPATRRSRQATGPSRRRRLGRAARPGGGASWLPRAGVLVALVAATIVVPLSGVAEPEPVTVEAVVAGSAVSAGYPTTVEVLASSTVPEVPTSVLAAVRGTEQLTQTTSRSDERSPLPGCDPGARPTSPNGLIPASDLCELWQPGQMLRGDAAVAASELNLNFRAAMGRNICLTDSYRSLAVQRRLAQQKPGLAATPGTSNHGWALAIDLCRSEITNRSVMTWLEDNGPTFGWDNPQWARRGGSGAYEPWHWEYVPGTTEMGTAF